MRPPKVLTTFAFRGVRQVVYQTEEVGDGLAMHRHTFNHLCMPLIGEIECFNEKGVSVVCRLGDQAVEFEAGVGHGIRALTPGAVFVNIMPSNHFEEYDHA